MQGPLTNARFHFLELFSVKISIDLFVKSY